MSGAAKTEISVSMHTVWGDMPPHITSTKVPGPSADVPFWCLLWPVAHDSFLNHMLGIPWQNMVSELALRCCLACHGLASLCWQEGNTI